MFYKVNSFLKLVKIRPTYNYLCKGKELKIVNKDLSYTKEDNGGRGGLLAFLE